MTQICLIRLLSMEEGQALDTNMALTQISAVYRMASLVNEGLDEVKRNFVTLINFCVRHTHPSPANADADSLPKAESRMG